MSSSPIIEKLPTSSQHLGETRKSPEINERDPGSESEEHAHRVEWAELFRIGFVALAAAAVWFRLWEPFPHVSVIGIAAALIGGYPIFKEAFENIIERKMTMELSMTIALLAALAIGEFFTALVITAFVLAAEVLESLTVGRGRRAIQSLLDFLPRTATVRRNGEVLEIPSDQVKVGDTVIVKPGGRIPVDGIVLGGRSFVEQAAITGEAMPVEKAPGDGVYAGTINQSGALEIAAQKLGRDTTFGRIIEAVERAEKSRAPIQKTADRLAGYLVYFALGAAVLTFIITHNIRSTISVVIVAGACGIAAGTPLAILGAIGRAAHQGAILVGSLSLFVAHGMTRGLPVSSDGAGGVSDVYVARAGQVLGSIRIADVLRPEAKNAVAAMRQMGLRTVLLSGDTQAVTSSVGRDLGVDEAVGGLLPEQKAKRVADLRSKGRNVAMVGDGINDAPALVEANVGIAMGSGTDVARESADVILIGSDLSKLVETLRVARRCRGIIMQNFVGTLVVDTIGVGMAALGFLNPLLAAFIHVTSELAFILNSTRLLPRGSVSGR